MGSGKMSSSSFATPSKDGARDGFRRGLGDVEAAGHVGVRRAGQDRVDANAPPASSARSDWVRLNAAALEIA